MLTVRLGKHMEAAIARIAKSSGTTKSSVVRVAVVRYLEDHEDAALTEQAQKVGGRGKSIAEVRKVLGLVG